jgi:hypothetical protein
MADLTVTGFIDQFMDADKPLDALAKISTITGRAGEAIAVGETIYLSADDEEWNLTNATGVATSAGMLAIAVSAGASGATISGQLLGRYYDTGIAGTGTLFLATTAGALTTTAPTGSGEIIRPFGYTLFSSGIMVCPDSTYVENGPLHLPGTGIRRETTDTSYQSGDAYSKIESNTSTQLVITIPANSSVAFDRGVSVDIVELGTGTTIVSGAAGVIVNGITGGTVTGQGQYNGLHSYQTLTDDWIVVGAG